MTLLRICFLQRIIFKNFRCIPILLKHPFELYSYSFNIQLWTQKLVPTVLNHSVSTFLLLQSGKWQVFIFSLKKSFYQIRLKVFLFKLLFLMVIKLIFWIQIFKFNIVIQSKIYNLYNLLFNHFQYFFILLILLPVDKIKLSSVNCI